MQEKKVEILYQIIGENIKAAREKKKYTQQNLADKSGFKRSSLVHIEKGRNRLPIHKLYTLAEILGIQIYELLPDNKKDIYIDKFSTEKIEDLNKVLNFLKDEKNEK